MSPKFALSSSRDSNFHDEKKPNLSLKLFWDLSSIVSRWHCDIVTAFKSKPIYQSPEGELLVGGVESERLYECHIWSNGQCSVIRAEFRFVISQLLRTRWLISVIHVDMNRSRNLPWEYALLSATRLCVQEVASVFIQEVLFCLLESEKGLN